MAAPAFCGVEPRVSTTVHQTHSRPESSVSVSSANKSRMTMPQSINPGRWTSTPKSIILRAALPFSKTFEVILVRKSMLIGSTLLAATLALLTQASGQTTDLETVISIEDLDCPICARNVKAAVEAVAGVSAAKIDVDKQEALVTPADGKTPSPKALWEAVESAGFKPTKLVGPDGTFTKKPAK